MNTFFNSKLVRYGKRNESSKMGMIYGKKQFLFEQTIQFNNLCNNGICNSFQIFCHKNNSKTNFQNRINEHIKNSFEAKWNLI